MPRRKKLPSGEWPMSDLIASDGDGGESSLLDVVDTVLNKGAALNGDIVLGVANVDLIYAKLSVLLAALDKVERQPSRPGRSGARRKSPRTRKPRRRR
jgi:hypothetical protein